MSSAAYDAMLLVLAQRAVDGLTCAVCGLSTDFGGPCSLQCHKMVYEVQRQRQYTRGLKRRVVRARWHQSSWGLAITVFIALAGSCVRAPGDPFGYRRPEELQTVCHSGSTQTFNRSKARWHLRAHKDDYEGPCLPTTEEMS